MKVILKDNFDRESTSDVLLEDDLSEEKAKEVADKYNSRHREDHPWFAKVVSDDYKLYEFDPNN